MIALQKLPQCFVLLMQETFPTETQLKDIQTRYKERGYTLSIPFNIVEIKYDGTSKKVTTFYAVEVRKEM